MPESSDEIAVKDVLEKSASERERSDRAHLLVSEAFDSMRRTRQRQKTARDFFRGRISAGLPKAIREAGIKHGGASWGDDGYLEYHAPQVMRHALDMISRFAAKLPEPKRHPVARGRESAAVTTRIERVAVGVMGQLFPYRQSCDPLILDSEAASVVIPSTAHYAELTDQYDYLPPEQWRRLPDDLKALWCLDEDHPGRMKRYARKYRRDSSGRPEWDDEYVRGKRAFRESTEKSAEAVEAEIEERMRAKIPLQIDLLLPQQFAPINPRWEGDRLTQDGLARREVLAGTTLYRRGFRWFERGPGLTPNQAMSSVAPVTLDTLWLQDGDGRPYLIYAIDGCRTYRKDGEGDWIDCLDLYETYGLDFLPICYQIGLHTLGPDFDDCIIPTLEPTIVPSLMRDRLVAMNDFHVANTSCGGWFVKVDPQIQAVMPELAARPEFKVTQMAATPVPGDIIPSVHPGAGPGLVVQKEMLDMDLLLAAGEQAQEASSGIQQALQGRDADRNNSMAWNAIDGLYAGTATNANRALACLARKINRDITLNILTEMPDNDTQSNTRSTVTIDPDMFGGDYRVVALRPDDWGSNPTRQAMIMAAQKDGQATWIEMREAVGDPDPLGTFAQIFVENLVMKTEEGKQLVLGELAKLNADVQALEEAKLRRDQLLNEQNVPTAMGAGVVDPSGLAPAVTLDATQAAGANPAANALNATAGAPQAALTQIANAGGDVAGVDFGGIGGG